MKECPECDGRGEVLDAPGDVLSGRAYWTPCPVCGGIAMKDESYWTRQLMTYLANNRRAWLCYKLADHFTAGIPDVVINGEGQTCWFELKCLKPGDNMNDRITKDSLQFHDMCKIEDNGVNCWYLVFLPGDKLQYVAVRPDYIRTGNKKYNQHPAVHTDFKWVTVLVENKYAK
jgi:hypothetical protein